MLQEQGKPFGLHRDTDETSCVRIHSNVQERWCIYLLAQFLRILSAMLLLYKSLFKKNQSKQINLYSIKYINFYVAKQSIYASTPFKSFLSIVHSIAGTSLFLFYIGNYWLRERWTKQIKREK